MYAYVYFISCLIRGNAHLGNSFYKIKVLIIKFSLLYWRDSTNEFCSRNAFSFLSLKMSSLKIHTHIKYSNEMFPFQSFNRPLFILCARFWGYSEYNNTSWPYKAHSLVPKTSYVYFEASVRTQLQNRRVLVPSWGQIFGKLLVFLSYLFTISCMFQNSTSFWKVIYFT